ncbi:hypothetical protein NL676_023334 [Syzygium grande]|nr:hypothetical protein NL676_023334 [Syzygium grande]
MFIFFSRPPHVYGVILAQPNILLAILPSSLPRVEVVLLLVTAFAVHLAVYLAVYLAVLSHRKNPKLTPVLLAVNAGVLIVHLAVEFTQRNRGWIVLCIVGRK